MLSIMQLLRPYSRRYVPSGTDPLAQIFAANSFAALIVFVDVDLQNGRSFRLIIDSESGVTHHASEHRLVISECLVMNDEYDYSYPMYVKCELTMNHLTVNMRRTSILAGRLMHTLFSQPIDGFTISVADVVNVADIALMEYTLRRALVRSSSGNTALSVPNGRSPCAIQRIWRAAYVELFNKLISSPSQHSRYAMHPSGVREVKVHVAFDETGEIDLARRGGREMHFDVHVPTGRAVEHHLQGDGCRVYAFDPFSATTFGHTVVISRFDVYHVVYHGSPSGHACLFGAIPAALPLWRDDRDDDNDVALHPHTRELAREVGNDPAWTRSLARMISEHRVVPDTYESHDPRRPGGLNDGGA
jgi:hypothetical protein